MPWCEECAKYYTPNSVNQDGTCRTCGALIQGPADGDEVAEAGDDKAPWHFKLMVVMVIAYLGWRLIQLVA